CTNDLSRPTPGTPPPVVGHLSPRPLGRLGSGRSAIGFSRRADGRPCGSGRRFAS
ncbi:MAG: hypothetical protein AVDCRST_MAG05-4398, partial [uncultured Rubrobacteraceae bacterium]